MTQIPANCLMGGTLIGTQKKHCGLLEVQVQVFSRTKLEHQQALQRLKSIIETPTPDATQNENTYPRPSTWEREIWYQIFLEIFLKIIPQNVCSGWLLDFPRFLLEFWFMSCCYDFCQKFWRDALLGVQDGDGEGSNSYYGHCGVQRRLQLYLKHILNLFGSMSRWVDSGKMNGLNRRRNYTDLQ